MADIIGKKRKCNEAPDSRSLLKLIEGSSIFQELATARPPLLAPADRTMHSRAQMYTNLLTQNSNTRPTLNKYNSN